MLLLALVCVRAPVAVWSHRFRASLLFLYHCWGFHLFEMNGFSVLDDELFYGDRGLLGNSGWVITELIHLAILDAALHTHGILRLALSLLRSITFIKRLKIGLAAQSMIDTVVVLGYKSWLECAVVVELVFLLLLSRLLYVPLLFVVHLDSSLVETSSRILNLL